MKANWQSKKLGDLLSVQNGYAFDSKAFGADGFPLIRIRDLKEGVTTETKFNAAFDAKYIVNAGDFLIGMDGDFSCHEWKGPPALLNQRVCRLQGFNDSLEPRFLFYGINAHLKAIEEVTGYTTVKHLSSKQILDIEMVVPPHSEQRRIVTLLDEAFGDIATAKANAERCLKNSNDLFASCIQANLAEIDSNVEHKPLDELCVIGDGNHSSNYPTKDELVEIGIPFIRCTNLIDGKISDVDMRFLSPEKHAQLKKGHLKTGDVLVTNRGEIGRTAIVDEAHDGANLNSQIAWLRCKDGLNNKYLFHALNSSEIQKHFESSKSGAALQQFTIKQLRALKIPLPSLEKQLSTAKKLDELRTESDRLESIYRQKLTALDDLKKSLLHQAFSGQL